jgi:hypothetical protein
MSSATSIDPQGLRPWQFFLLAGMLSATAVVIVATGQSPASIITLSITVLAASLVAMGSYRSLAPLVQPEAASVPSMVAGRTRAALEREKALVLRSIKELEFDYAMGKLVKSDFDEMSGRLRARAIGLMRQLDASGGYREAIERELQLRLRTPAFVAASDATADPSEPVASSLDSCPSCEGINDPDARFCKHCGSKLAA